MIAKNSGTTKKLLIALDAPPQGGGSSREHEPKGPEQNEDRVKEVRALLQKAGIEFDDRIVKTISDNFNSKLRLLSLFKLLKKCTIPLTDVLNHLIASNVPRVNSIARLLEFTREIKIDSKYVKLEELLTISFSEENLISGLRQLSDKGYLDPVSIRLMFKNPENALELAKLIINLGKRAFSIDSIESKLNQFSKMNMNSIVVLLTFIIDKNLFYPDLLDILLRQENYADIIYEGAKKLALENLLSSGYFEIIENNPGNANIIAKNILLLSSVSLIDYQNKKDLLIVSQLGLGEFFFLDYLKNADLLNSETYKIICQNNSIFSKKEVIDIFRKIPLFDTFSKEELMKLISLIHKPEVSESEYNTFIETISSHQRVFSGFTHE